MHDCHADIYEHPQAYCTALTKAAGSNFYYAFMPLPRERRDALFVIYAFCRYADDIVDEEADKQVAAKRLDEWRDECHAALKGNPGHPITIRLAEVIEQFEIDPGLPFELLDGMAMDLATPVRYPDFPTLRRYCYRAASVVGMMCIKVFGCQHPDAMRFADAHGMAFQLTNILRDVAKDAEIGRIYLPQDELARFGVTEQDLLDGHDFAAYRDLMAFQAERARDYYKEAAILAASLPRRDQRALLPSRIMGAIYGALLDEMTERQFRTGAPVSLSTPRKLYLAGKAYLDHLGGRW
jgi:phytoene synthase